MDLYTEAMKATDPEPVDGMMPVKPEPPAFLQSQPLTPIETADLIAKLAETGRPYTAEEIAVFTAPQISMLRGWLTSCAAIADKLGDALTANDLPAAPGFLKAVEVPLEGSGDVDPADWETCESCEQKKADVSLRAGADVPLCDACAAELVEADATEAAAEEVTH